MTVDNNTEHLGYFHEIPDALYCYPKSSVYFFEKSCGSIFEDRMLWINAVKRNERFFIGETVEIFSL